MIDIHSHILPDVDDGAADLYDTLGMITAAAKSGITAMIATPHCNIPGRYQNYFTKEYITVIQQVREAVHKAGLSVSILPGAEVFVTADLPQLLMDGKIMTLNQSRYLLIEFDFEEDPQFAQYMLEELQNLRVIPVIAHAERYRFVQKQPEIVYDWRKKGYPVQINKGSFQGRFGKIEEQTAYLLMDHHLVSVIASDAHSPHVRTPIMTNVYEELLERYPERYLEMLFTENPGRICRNEPILGFKAKKIE